MTSFSTHLFLLYSRFSNITSQNLTLIRVNWVEKRPSVRQKLRSGPDYDHPSTQNILHSCPDANTRKPLPGRISHVIVQFSSGTIIPKRLYHFLWRLNTRPEKLKRLYFWFTVYPLVLYLWRCKTLLLSYLRFPVIPQCLKPRGRDIFWIKLEKRFVIVPQK